MASLCRRRLGDLQQEVQGRPPCKRRCREEQDMRRRCREEQDMRRRCREEDMRRRCREEQDMRRRCREEEDMRRRCRVEEDMRRRSSGEVCKENRPPDQQRPSRTLKTLDPRRTRTRSRSRSRAEIQVCRPEVRVAHIKSTRIQTSVQTSVQTLELQIDPGSAETHMDQNRSTRIRQTRTKDQSSETRTRTKTRTRRKVHPSVFRGRGQLQLSITSEAGHLLIHIHRARGLRTSWDSYVKVVVTSDPRTIRMKTPTVLNQKNPVYSHRFRLRLSSDIIASRLLVSVYSRCRQLIGCMSFGISSLVSSAKPVTGWFYLLGEEFGLTKHLRVTSQRHKPIRSPEKRPAADRTPDSPPGPDLDHIIRDRTNQTPDSPPGPDLNHIIRDRNNRTPDSPPGPDLNHIIRDWTIRSQTSSQTSSPTKSSSGPDISLPSINTRDSSTQQVQVCVVRGKDGFGFTICSDSPVRVQDVDPGGPARRSGLRQGDSVLQLNGLPVETWKCVDLAHVIRNCSSQIILVVWRGPPNLRTGCEALLRPPTTSQTTGRKLLPLPGHSRTRRDRGSRVRSGLGTLGSLWKDRKEDQEKDQEDQEVQEVPEYSSRTATLKGTRVTSSHGENYIILSPLNPGPGPMPVYQDQKGTMGRLYQTQNLFHDPPPGSSGRPFTSSPHGHYGNYQNCTIVQSHRPSSYGAFVTPKTLIFPVFVQPLDLCSPDRTLMMSEEVILHQEDLPPTKVTVLVYSDLLLFTREDEAGRCNVLQSPVYLNTLQLREVVSEPLHVYALQRVGGAWLCVFSLETFSIQQRLRLSLCLHDNIQQLVAMETGDTQQFSDLPSDFGLLSLGQSDLLYLPSSRYSSSDPPLLPTSATSYSPRSSFSSPSPPPHFSDLSTSSPPPRTFTHPAQLLSAPSPVWVERGGAEEEKRKRRWEEVEERQMGEGESASETSERAGGPTHFAMKEEEEDSDEEEEEGGGVTSSSSSSRPAALRRSLSEGSLLKEPRSPRFLSDSTLHQLDLRGPAPHTLRGPTPRRPSLHALRDQLTKEGGSLHHLLLLLNGTKDVQLRKKKTKSLAADVRSRFLFLRRSSKSSSNRESAVEMLRWAESLEALLTNEDGVAMFGHFLRSEFSEENLDFWLAVEKFKRTRPLSKMAARAVKIYDEFISTTATRQVNVDSAVRELTNQRLRMGVSPGTFQLAQDQIFNLMKTDSYPRFLKSRLYTQLANQEGRSTESQTVSQS